MRIVMLCTIFCHFYKNGHFFPGEFVGKLGSFFPNFNLFFCCLTSSNRRTVQKWGGIPELCSVHENVFILPENFFQKFCTLFIKYCNSTSFDVTQPFLMFLQKVTSFVGSGYAWSKLDKIVKNV